MPQPPQAHHWVDKLVSGIWAWQAKTDQPKLHVDDMKTPSGRVHTGALRGVLIHDLVAKALTQAAGDRPTPIQNTYIINDMDPMDGLPGYLDQAEYSQHMGKPLYKIPAPPLDSCGIDLTGASKAELADFKKAKNFAEVYAFDFMHAFRKLGCSQELIWSHQLYESGQMDETIQLALDNVDKFRKIYKEVADYDLPTGWFPFQVTCPECGKVGTTLVTDWDGQQVTFQCQPNKVEWAQGCGHQGKISPFGGNGKLLWKVDWPAHWRVLGINIEGAGKDHTSAGSSRDMANAICSQVFDITVPFDIPYEWILIRGAKMSSSKGVGTSAREFTELFPPEIGRFLFVNKHYNQVIDFDPATMAIPDLFDQYDQGARIFWGEEDGDQRLGRSFELSQIGKTPQAHYLPRFRDLAMWIQHPEFELQEKVTEAKGSPLTDDEQTFLADRLHYVELWLDRYAPEEYQLRPQEELPAAAATLTTDQRAFLQQVDQLVDSQSNWDPQDLQQQLFDLAKTTLGAQLGFQAIYLAFLGKTAGPRAGWFLLSIEPALRKERIQSLESVAPSEDKIITPKFETFTDSSIFSIDDNYAQAYPSTTVGIAIIKGVKIQPSNPELESQKQALLEEFTGLTTKQIGEYPEIQSFRKMYKQMGIDWHSRRPSPEALLRRVAQGKELYTVNTCVDAYNLAVMKNRVSVGAFDLDQLSLPTVLKIAEGGEEIHLLGDDKPTTIKAGEVCYFDQNGAYNLDFNYRDAQKTMVTNQTTNLLINVEGVFDITPEQVAITLQQTIDLITQHCGGTVEKVGIISAQ